MVHFGEACGQIVLPDKSLLLGQKLVENAKMEKSKMQHFDLFKTLCSRFVIDFWRENSNFFFEWKVSKQVMYFHIDLVLEHGNFF